ncbi:hypothetical protein FRC08_007845 [Ceratobasidium sp. 394]|nr:hypothetical protein FRC08_007845 [Ceratobasidium sp. 394]
MLSVQSVFRRLPNALQRLRLSVSQPRQLCASLQFGDSYFSIVLPLYLRFKSCEDGRILVDAWEFTSAVRDLLELRYCRLFERCTVTLTNGSPLWLLTSTGESWETSLEDYHRLDLFLPRLPLLRLGPTPRVVFASADSLNSAPSGLS